MIEGPLWRAFCPTSSTVEHHEGIRGSRKHGILLVNAVAVDKGIARHLLPESRGLFAKRQRAMDVSSPSGPRLDASVAIAAHRSMSEQVAMLRGVRTISTSMHIMEGRSRFPYNDLPALRANRVLEIGIVIHVILFMLVRVIR